MVVVGEVDPVVDGVEDRVVHGEEVAEEVGDDVIVVVVVWLEVMVVVGLDDCDVVGDDVIVEVPDVVTVVVVVGDVDGVVLPVLVSVVVGVVISQSAKVLSKYESIALFRTAILPSHVSSSCKNPPITYQMHIDGIKSCAQWRTK